MNPIALSVLLFTLGGSAGKKGLPALPIKLPRPPISPAYIDTFKMELLLDRLHSMTNALDKVNHLSQMQKISTGSKRLPSIDQVTESLDAVKGFLADGKTSRQVDSLSSTLAGARNLTDMEELMKTMGPVLSILKNTSFK